MRSVLLSVLLACGLATAADFSRPSYAEIQVGLATSTGLASYQDVESERVAPGSVGTTLLFSGYFPVVGQLSVSPTFSLLTTDGEVSNDPSVPAVFDIRYSQREIGIDALLSQGDLQKLQLGLGSSIAWWTAAEENARGPNGEGQRRGRSIDGQALMARGVAHLALRNPQVSGASLKLVATWPLAELLRVNNTAATGYIGLQCGFSMILN